MRVKCTTLPNELLLCKLERAKSHNLGESLFVLSASGVTVKEGLR